MTRTWLSALVLAATISLVSCSPSGDGKHDGGLRPVGKPSVASAPGRFATDAIPGLAVLNPAEELAEFDPNGILRWMPVMGADAYEVWVYQDAALSQVVEFSGALMSRQYQFRQLSGGFTYYVRIYYRYQADMSWRGDLPVFELTTTTRVLKPRLSNSQEELDAFGSTSTLRWAPVAGADIYEVWVYRDAALVAFAETSGTLRITQYQVTSLKPGHSYFVRLFARVNGEFHAGGALRLTLPTEVNRARVLNAQEEIDGFATNGILRWTPVTGATKYEVWVFTNPNSSVIYESSGPLAARQYQMRTLQPGTAYYVQIYALVNDVWQVGSPVKITTIGQPLASRLTTPQEDLENFSTTGTLSWTEVPGATGYELWIYGNAGLGTIIENGPGSGRSYQVRRLCTKATYYVQVYALVNGQWVTGWATRLDVTKGESPQDCVPPAPTVRLSATPDDVVVGQSTTVTWTSDFASSCTASGAWTGIKGTSGSETVGPLLSNSLFILICNGPSGATRAEYLVVAGASMTLSISIADQSQPEGNSGSSPMLFNVTLDRAFGADVWFEYRTVPGSATGGVDYATSEGVGRFPPGTTSTTIDVPIIGDLEVEPDETFTVQLTRTSDDAQIVRGTATGTILDDGDASEPSTTAGIWYGAFVDGVDGGSFPVKSVVTEAGAARFVIGDGMNAAGQVFGTVPTTGTDIKVNLTGVFYPNNYWSDHSQVTDVTIDGAVTPRVAWNGTYKETTGYGTFELSYQKDLYERPASLDLVAGSYSGTIIHDDSLDPIGYTITLGINASGALSGNDTRGCQYAGSVTVPRPDRNYYGVTVTAANCAAQAGQYTGVMFFDGTGDGLTDLVYMANDGNSIWTGAASRRVAGFAGISIADAGKAEGTGINSLLEFTVTLDRTPDVPVTVGYRTVAGTATAGSDYVPVQDTLTFPAGVPIEKVRITIIGDATPEGPETFTVQLFNPSTNATIVDGVAIGTIDDDDAAPATFTALGKLSTSFSGESFATGVSDGGVVVGYSPNQTGMYEAFSWQNGVMTGLGMGATQSYAYGISQDGSMIAGGGRLTAAGDEAFRLYQGSRTGLGDLPGGAYYSVATAVGPWAAVGYSSSAAASVGGYEAFQWRGFLEALGDLPGGLFDSRANAVAGNSYTVVGRGLSASGQEACRWDLGGNPIGLGDLPGGAFQSEAFGVSADGSVIVGYGTSASGKEAFRWQGGVMTGLGDLDGGQFQSQALAVSADGGTIVGTAYDDTGPRAMIWNQAQGMRKLQDVLAGSVPSGWRLTVATAISGNGRYIVGYGYNPSGFREAFRASLY